jgi:hypothetical protein
VAQEDQHAPTLSVQETVRFAFDCMAAANDDSLDATLAPPMGHVTPRAGSIDSPFSPLHTPPHTKASGGNFVFHHTGAEALEGGEGLDGSGDSTSTTGSWPSTPLLSPAHGRAADRVRVIQAMEGEGVMMCWGRVV